MSHPKKVTKLRAGSQVHTPRAGGVIRHRSGAEYEVEENGSTIKRVRDEPLELRDALKTELARCGWPTTKIKTWREAANEEVRADVARSIRNVDAQDLHTALRDLPTGCGQARIAKAAREL
jgi:hypothetical protein